MKDSVFMRKSSMSEITDIPSVRTRIRQAQAILAPWFKIKDNYATAYQSKNLELAEALQNELVDILSKFYALFHAPLGTAKRNQQADWRRHNAMTGNVATLYNQIQKSKTAIAERNIANFIKVIDRAQGTVQTCINLALRLDRDGYGETSIRSKKIRDLKIKARSNAEKIANWRGWIEKNVGEKLTEKSPVEIYNEMNEKLRLIAERERKKWEESQD